MQYVYFIPELVLSHSSSVTSEESAIMGRGGGGGLLPPVPAVTPSPSRGNNVHGNPENMSSEDEHFSARNPELAPFKTASDK